MASPVTATDPDAYSENGSSIVTTSALVSRRSQGWRIGVRQFSPRGIMRRNLSRAVRRSNRARPEALVIVRQTSGEDVHLITQPDHAHLAGRIMRHCPALLASPRAGQILRAVAEHDNGWAEADAAPQRNPETGEILDFVNAPLDVRHGVWPRAVRRLSREPWTAALVAQHAITVYDRYRVDPAWTTFFAGMREHRDAMLIASGGTLADLEHDYVWVRLGDLVSLTFCTGWTDAQHIAGWTVRLENDRVRVSPDPFDGAEVVFEVGARRLPHRAYPSDADLQRALRDAQAVELRGRAGG